MNILLVDRHVKGNDLLLLDFAGSPLFRHLLANLEGMSSLRIGVISNHPDWLEGVNIEDSINPLCWGPGERFGEAIGLASTAASLLMVDISAALLGSEVMTSFVKRAQHSSFGVVVLRSQTVPEQVLALFVTGQYLERLLRSEGGLTDAGLISIAEGIEAKETVMLEVFGEQTAGPVIDSMVTLAHAERQLLMVRAVEAMHQGVHIRDPERIDIRGDLVCGRGVEIDVNVVIEGRVILGDGVHIGANCILINSTIGAGTRINAYSLVEHASIGEWGFVGPYGRVRPGSRLGDRVQIGNFVEIKDSRISSDCRINHLAFVGDADLGEKVTIGAGTITCNHDGVGINQTVIGKGVFVGSGCNLVAPLQIGSHSTVGSGSTITEKVPEGLLTLARARQVTIKKWNGPRSRRDKK